MASSKTDICNGALSLVGQEFITDFDTDLSEEGDQCRIVFDRSKEALLTRHAWRFAQKTAALTADATAQNSLFSASYILPGDYLALISSDLDQWGEPYFLEGRRLVTDFSSVTLTYIANITNSGFFSPGFTRALEYMVASRLAFPLTKDRVLAELMMTMFETVFAEESNRDATNGARNETYILDALTSVRIQ